MSNLEQIQLTDSLEESANRLLKEISSLRFARHRLRDMQDRTFLQIVFYEKREENVPQQLYIDENFGICGRIGLEITIQEWWKQKRHEKRQIAFALLDFVKFGEANDEHGIMICDKIIKHFGNRFKEHFDSQDLVGIYTGNCFLIATSNMGLKKTITEIERIRQRCEKTTFRYNAGKDSLKLQLTCAVTEAIVTQSKDDVLNVLEKTLSAAKKAGRNFTFLSIPGPLDKNPEKVEAPNLGEEENEVEI
jgi:diguanylate cyclase (GGDEF)-like protein